MALKYNFYILIFFFVTYGYFWQGGGSNQNARLYLAQAIINQGTFSIDQYKEDSPDQEFVNLGDWSHYNGHYYSNKSPGLSFLMVPPVAATQYLLDRFCSLDQELKSLICAYMGNLFSTVLLSSCLCLLIFRVCYKFFGYTLNNSFLLTLSYGLGTLAFPYSSSLHSHQSAAFFSFFAFVISITLVHGSFENKRRANMFAFAAGLGAAMAVIVESSAIFLLIVTAVYLLWFKSSRLHFAWFVLGILPIVFVQLYYNYACFGSPFASGYTYANPAVMLRIDGALFGFPSLYTVTQLIVMPYRGMFISSPVLLLALPGAYLLLKKQILRVEAICCIVGSVLFFLFIASFYASYGGWAAGPRYLVPLFPWLFFLTIMSFEWRKKLFILVSIISVCLNFAIAAVGTEIPSLVENPLMDVIFPAILSGMVSISPMPLSHYKNYPDIQILINFYNWPLLQNFSSFNFGEFLFPHSLLSLFPLLLFWTFMVIAWLLLQERKS